MSMLRFRRSRSGQAIVIMALAMVAICGMLALAIDAGRLYFERRLMQDAADAGALAGAQDLVGTITNPNGTPAKALYHGQQDSFSVFGLSAIGSYTDAAYQQPSVSQTQGGYTVTTVAPTGYNNKQVQVSISFNATGTFAQVLGFNSINIQATATAEAGTNAKTYAIFAYGGIGTGNTINIQGGGYAQVDNGQDGTDACSGNPSGETISNAKFHVPTGYPGVININGNVFINQANDNQHMAKYWVTQPPFATGQDPEPNYLVPDTSSVPMAHARAKQKNVPSPGSFSSNGITVYNNTGTTRDIVIYYPGKYSGSGNNITIPNSANLDSSNGLYVFANGLYLFTGGASLVTHGGNISNTSTGLPHYVGGVGASDLPAATDGTDGVEFVFDNGSFYSADNTQSANAGSSFFVSPSFVPSGSTHIAFYIASTNSYANPWTETFNAQSSNAPRYQIWGSVFDSSANGGTQGGTGMTLTGVQVGPHNFTPSDDAAPNGPGSAGQYAVTGEFIGFTLTIDDGTVQGNTAGTPPSCPNGIGNGTPALLVQYNKNFAPAPGVNSFLVK
jgi:Flp pilus assembly protein TadG